MTFVCLIRGNVDFSGSGRVRRAKRSCQKRSEVPLQHLKKASVSSVSSVVLLVAVPSVVLLVAVPSVVNPWARWLVSLCTPIRNV